MKYVLMMRQHVSYTGYSGWGEWMDIEDFKTEQEAKWEMQSCLEYNSRTSRQFKIEAR